MFELVITRFFSTIQPKLIEYLKSGYDLSLDNVETKHQDDMALSDCS